MNNFLVNNYLPILLFKFSKFLRDLIHLLTFKRFRKISILPENKNLTPELKVEDFDNNEKIKLDNNIKEVDNNNAKILTKEEIKKLEKENIELALSALNLFFFLVLSFVMIISNLFVWL